MSFDYADIVYEQVKDYNEVFLEYGLLKIQNKNKIKRYIYVEYDSFINDENIIVIPSGTYYCLKNDFSMIENIPEIFNSVIDRNKPFMAIEVEVFSSKYKINRPINELRIIPLQLSIFS